MQTRTRARLAALACALLASPAAANLTLVPSEGGGGFGDAIALSGPALVAGAPYRAPSSRGGAFVFRFDGSSWVETQLLTAPDAADGDAFGFDVAADGDVLAVSSPGVPFYGNPGAVYVYRFDGERYVFEQQLASPDATCGPRAVAVFGDLLAFGATEGGGRGKVYVFQRSGGSWSFVHTITSGDDNFRFGEDVALSGAVLVIGAPADDDGDFSSNFGAAHVYRWNGVSFAF